MSYTVTCRIMRTSSIALCTIIAIVSLGVALGGRLAASEEVAANPLSVGRMIFCRSIEEREPKGVAETFPVDVARVYCFTAILNAGPGETHVVHKWYRGDELMAEVKLRAQGEYWRTWSVKTIEPDSTGRWRVDVVSAAGVVLKSASFVLGAAEVVEDSDSEVDAADARDQENAEEDRGGGVDSREDGVSQESAGE